MIVIDDVEYDGCIAYSRQFILFAASDNLEGNKDYECYSLMTNILKINRHSTQHKILCLELVSYHYHKQPVCRFLVLRVE